ncbi:MAG: cupin [Dinoroseobacter sp.]|nr:cupin [Dinoroseobacter sp.]
MKYFDLFADDTGESRFRDIDVALEERTFAPPAKAIEISETEAASGMLFLRLRAGWNEPIHPTPVAQTLICLRGRVRVTASDGDTREVGPGDVWRMADTHGKGHHTEVISADDFECVIAQHA